MRNPPHNGVALCLMSLNIHKGFTALNTRFVLPALRHAIRQVGADLVLLQEVHGRRAEAPDERQIEFLADAVWPQHAYGRNAVYPRGDHGNAVLSRFPILQANNHDVSQGGPERRGLLHCVIDVPGTREPLHVVCVHLGLLERHRQKQLRQLDELLQRDVPPSAPLVVAGDFNDWRQRVQAPMQAMGLQEVHAAAGLGVPRTFPARLPLLAVDRIYVGRARYTQPLQLTRQPWASLSDHVPVAALIEP